MSNSTNPKRLAKTATIVFAIMGLAISALASKNDDDRAIALEILKQNSASAATGSAAKSVSPPTSATSSTSAATSASSSGSESANQPTNPAKHALEQTRRALDRADQAKAAGDTITARHLEGLAREWADMARDILRASEAESRADQNQLAAVSASASARRTQAMIDTLASRRSRAEGELQQVRSESSASLPAAAISAARVRPAPARPTPTSAAPTSTGTAPKAEQE